MKDGICPKCEAENVHIVDGNRTGVDIPGKGVFSAISFTNFYICGDCGFVEIYVEDKNDLPKINKDWAQVKVKNNETDDLSG